MRNCFFRSYNTISNLGWNRSSNQTRSEEGNTTSLDIRYILSCIIVQFFQFHFNQVDNSIRFQFAIRHVKLVKTNILEWYLEIESYKKTRYSKRLWHWHQRHFCILQWEAKFLISESNYLVAFDQFRVSSKRIICNTPSHKTLFEHLYSHSVLLNDGWFKGHNGPHSRLV